MPKANQKQVIAVEETTPGVLEAGLFAAANAKGEFRDIQSNFDVTLFNRATQRASATPTPGTAGIKAGTIQFTMDISGHGVTTPSVPPWDKFMKGCGFRSVDVRRVALNTVAAGPLRHGEVITFSGGSTATVIHDTYPDGSGNCNVLVADHDGSALTAGAFTVSQSTTTGSNAAGVPPSVGHSWYPISKATQSFTYTTLSGAINVNEVWEGATSKAKLIVLSHDATAKKIIYERFSGDLQAGETVQQVGTPGDNVSVAANLQQEDIPTLSMAAAEDGVYKQIKGARGTVSSSGTIGETQSLTFNFTGLLVDPPAVDAPNLSGVAADVKAPPSFLNLGALVGLEGDSTVATYCPRAASITWDVGNSLAIGQDICEAAGAKFVTITAPRAGTLTIDPELDLESSYPILDRAAKGTLGRLEYTYGTVNENKFYQSFPGLQFTSVPSGDRNGIATREWAANLTGGTLTNAGGGSGSDNEMVITYLRA